MQKIKSLVKTYYKPFLLIFAIYLIAFFTLYRDQHFFADDTTRSAVGYDYSTDFNRVTSNVIVHLLQLNLNILGPIAPFGQFFGFALLAISSLMLVFLFTGEKPSLKKPAPLILSLFLGLNPLMINAWQYQFETPWFSAAIFFSILPFVLFWKKLPSLKLIFSNSGKTVTRLKIDENLFSFLKILSATIVCNVLVWTSWQVATGIFPAIGLALVFSSLINREKLPWPSIITFILAYIIATVFAYISTLGMSSYVDTSMFPLAEFIPGVFRNLGYALRVIATSFNATWLVFSVLAVIGAFLLNKFRTFALALLFLILAIPVSLGPCLALEIYHINARAMVGPVLSIAVFALILLPKNFSESTLGGKLSNTLRPKSWRIRLKPLFLAPAFCLLYSFAVHAWSYGNALTDQYRYEEFRISMILQDLGELYPTEPLDGYIYNLKGSAGLSPLMINHFLNYPVASYTFFNYMSGLSSQYFSYERFRRYYGRPQNAFMLNPEDENEATDDAFFIDCDHLAEDGFTPVHQTYFHTIYDDRASGKSAFDPLELIENPEKLSEDEIKTLNLTKKDFSVCIVLNPEAKNPHDDEVTIYDGQLVEDEFKPYMYSDEDTLEIKK